MQSFDLKLLLFHDGHSLLTDRQTNKAHWNNVWCRQFIIGGGGIFISSESRLHTWLLRRASDLVVRRFRHEVAQLHLLASPASNRAAHWQRGIAISPEIPLPSPQITLIIESMKILSAYTLAQSEQVTSQTRGDGGHSIVDVWMQDVQAQNQQIDSRRRVQYGTGDERTDTERVSAWSAGSTCDARTHQHGCRFYNNTIPSTPPTHPFFLEFTLRIYSVVLPPYILKYRCGSVGSHLPFRTPQQQRGVGDTKHNVLSLAPSQHHPTCTTTGAA